MCIGKEVTIHQTGVDGYQRPIAFVSADGLNLNAEMIRLGFAWHYKKYSASSELTDLESEARDAKRGLWVDVEAIEQWAWRSVN
jgi:endonuclease YncB( thermonuclease family)